MVNLNHRQAQGLLQTAADRALSSRERISLEAHLAGCAKCRSYSNRLGRLQDDLGDLFRTRWNNLAPELSSEAIQRRSIAVARKNNFVHTFATAGMVIALLAAVILAGSFVRWPVSFTGLPIQPSTQTLDATGISAGNEAAGSTYLEQPQIPSTFPPAGIGKICPSTSASPQVGDGIFIWPTSTHFLAGKDFSENHPAIDIGGDLGEAVRAADAGVAVMAGFNTWGYGNLIILDHGKGRYTLYGHLDTIAVTCGQNVYKGQVIGSIGKTGNTTKPQLHFQVLSGSSFVNPWSVLPPSEKCEPITYIVQPGDTLYQIAILFYVSVESIHVVNDFPNNTLTPGMELIIPLCREETPIQSSTPIHANTAIPSSTVEPVMKCTVDLQFKGITTTANGLQLDFTAPYPVAAASQATMPIMGLQLWLNGYPVSGILSGLPDIYDLKRFFVTSDLIKSGDEVWVMLVQYPICSRSAVITIP